MSIPTIPLDRLIDTLDYPGFGHCLLYPSHLSNSSKQQEEVFSSWRASIFSNRSNQTSVRSHIHCFNRLSLCTGGFLLIRSASHRLSGVLGSGYHFNARPQQFEGQRHAPDLFLIMTWTFSRLSRIFWLVYKRRSRCSHLSLSFLFPFISHPVQNLKVFSQTQNSFLSSHTFNISAHSQSITICL